MNELPVVHTSDRIAFKRCRRKWDLGSYMRQNLTSIRVNDKLWLGTGVHDALAKYYSSLSTEPVDLVLAFTSWCDQQIAKITADNNGLWDEQKDMIEEQIRLGVSMLENYSLWAATEDARWFERVAFTEKDFKVPIMYPGTQNQVGWYVGRVDGVVEDEYGLYWLMEHKTAAAVDTSKLPLDEQCSAYIWAAEQIYGVKMEGVIYNILRKKAPRAPETLKKGGLSTAKNIDTTWQTYMQAIVDMYGPEQAEIEAKTTYKDILCHLYEKGNTFVVREKVRRNRYEVQNVGIQVYEELTDMTRPDLFIYRNPTRDCMWDCDFRSVCLCMNDGSDFKYLIDSCYKVRDPQEVDYITGDE